MCVLGNHDQSGVAQLSDYGCQMFAKELATFCEAYNIDGVWYTMSPRRWPPSLG